MENSYVNSIFSQCEAWFVYFYHLLLYYAGSASVLTWIIVVVLIPMITLALIFISAGKDFLQIVSLKMDILRFFGDLFHFFVIFALGCIAEIFSIYMLLNHL